MSALPRPPFIAHYSELKQPVTDPTFSNFGGQRSSLGSRLGLSRIGIHYDILPPGNRTSRPHAESAEEEFVLVVQGEPDLWLDGVLHPLAEGDAVGFPAGTGITHSFLNNSTTNVHLLVIGEHAVAGNKLWYPLNPERMTEIAEWGEAWLDGPRNLLGPHDGKARAGTRASASAPRPDFVGSIRDGLEPLKDGGFPDMGGLGNHIGRKLGLTRIGMHYEITPPGARSSFPHAEKEEEEFVFVLGGKPDVWIDGNLHPLNPGDAVAFPSGTGIAHSFLNNSDEDMHLFILGEHNRPGNLINYPINPERMKLFTRLKRAWLDAPVHELGPHDGKAKAGTRR